MLTTWLEQIRHYALSPFSPRSRRRRRRTVKLPVGLEVLEVRQLLSASALSESQVEQLVAQAEELEVLAAAQKEAVDSFTQQYDETLTSIFQTESAIDEATREIAATESILVDQRERLAGLDEALQQIDRLPEELADVKAQKAALLTEAKTLDVSIAETLRPLESSIDATLAELGEDLVVQTPTLKLSGVEGRGGWGWPGQKLRFDYENVVPGTRIVMLAQYDNSFSRVYRSATLPDRSGSITFSIRGRTWSRSEVFRFSLMQSNVYSKDGFDLAVVGNYVRGIRTGQFDAPKLAHLGLDFEDDAELVQQLVAAQLLRTRALHEPRFLASGTASGASFSTIIGSIQARLDYWDDIRDVLHEAIRRLRITDDMQIHSRRSVLPHVRVTLHRQRNPYITIEGEDIPANVYVEFKSGWRSQSFRLNQGTQSLNVRPRVWPGKVSIQVRRPVNGGRSWQSTHIATLGFRDLGRQFVWRGSLSKLRHNVPVLLDLSSSLQNLFDQGWRRASELDRSLDVASADITALHDGYQKTQAILADIQRQIANAPDDRHRLLEEMAVLEGTISQFSQHVPNFQFHLDRLTAALAGATSDSRRDEIQAQLSLLSNLTRSDGLVEIDEWRPEVYMFSHYGRHINLRWDDLPVGHRIGFSNSHSVAVDSRDGSANLSVNTGRRGWFYVNLYSGEGEFLSHLRRLYINRYYVRARVHATTDLSQFDRDEVVLSPMPVSISENESKRSVLDAFRRGEEASLAGDQRRAAALQTSVIDTHEVYRDTQARQAEIRDVLGEIADPISMQIGRLWLEEIDRTSDTLGLTVISSQGASYIGIGGELQPIIHTGGTEHKTIEVDVPAELFDRMFEVELLAEDGQRVLDSIFVDTNDQILTSQIASDRVTPNIQVAGLDAAAVLVAIKSPADESLVEGGLFRRFVRHVGGTNFAAAVVVLDASGGTGNHTITHKDSRTGEVYDSLTVHYDAETRSVSLLNEADRWLGTPAFVSPFAPVVESAQFASIRQQLIDERESARQQNLVDKMLVGLSLDTLDISWQTWPGGFTTNNISREQRRMIFENVDVIAHQHSAEEAFYRSHPNLTDEAIAEQARRDRRESWGWYSESSIRSRLLKSRRHAISGFQYQYSKNLQRWREHAPSIVVGAFQSLIDLSNGIDAERNWLKIQQSYSQIGDVPYGSLVPPHEYIEGLFATLESGQVARAAWGNHERAAAEKVAAEYYGEFGPYTAPIRKHAVNDERMRTRFKVFESEAQRNGHQLIVEAEFDDNESTTYDIQRNGGRVTVTVPNHSLADRLALTPSQQRVAAGLTPRKAPSGSDLSVSANRNPSPQEIEHQARLAVRATEAMNNRLGYETNFELDFSVEEVDGPTVTRRDDGTIAVSMPRPAHDRHLMVIAEASSAHREGRVSLDEAVLRVATSEDIIVAEAAQVASAFSRQNVPSSNKVSHQSSNEARRESGAIEVNRVFSNSAIGHGFLVSREGGFDTHVVGEQTSHGAINVAPDIFREDAGRITIEHGWNVDSLLEDVDQLVEELDRDVFEEKDSPLLDWLIAAMRIPRTGTEAAAELLVPEPTPDRLDRTIKAELEKQFWMNAIRMFSDLEVGE